MWQQQKQPGRADSCLASDLEERMRMRMNEWVSLCMSKVRRPGEGETQFVCMNVQVLLKNVSNSFERQQQQQHWRRRRQWCRSCFRQKCTWDPKRRNDCHTYAKSHKHTHSHLSIQTRQTVHTNLHAFFLTLNCNKNTFFSARCSERKRNYVNK